MTFRSCRHRRLLTTLALACAVGLAPPRADAAAGKRAKRGRVPATAPVVDPVYGDRADVLQFAEELAARSQLPLEWLVSELAQARRIETVRRLIAPPPAGSAKNWAAYRDRFVEPQRIAAGVEFWRTNADWLARAEERFGVAAAVVVGIVGVETYYGRITGGFRVIDALATLAFDYPAVRRDRSAFFRDELAAFFVLCAREGNDPQRVKGSYAGAMGLPQFMPSSVNRHAVDFDGDQHIDLLNSAADVVGSVAHYLAEFGWQRGLPTHFRVAPPVDSSERTHLLGPDIVPTFSAAQLAANGAVLDAPGRLFDGPLALVELQNGNNAPSFIAGTANFYAVTRYNRSSYYALAVIELGEAVARARQTR